MRIMIMRYSSETYDNSWYKKHIGKTYEVMEYDKDRYRVKEKGSTPKLIYKKDTAII